MRIKEIIAENWKMDGGAAFGVVPRVMWQKYTQADENNMIRITSRCLYVEDGDRKILFDTGMGNKQSEKYYSYRYLYGNYTLVGSLKKEGLSPDEITDVVFTHLHDDHCGGAVKIIADANPELVFKNATHHISTDQWLWANNPNSREIGTFFKENFIPIEKSGKLNLIEKPGVFTKNISLFQVDGHTVGQIIPKINLNGRTVVFVADFIPSSAHIPIPYIASVDIQPLLALKEKEAFLNEAVQNDYILLFEHDPDVVACSLKLTEKGVRIDRTLELDELMLKN